MPTTELPFEFDDVLPTIQRAHTKANRDDAEEALSTAMAEGLEKGWSLTPANLVRCARFRLLSAMRRRDRQNLSLDAFAEDTEDQAPVELAVQEVDFDSHSQLREAAENPVLAARLAALQAGGEPVLVRRGENHPRCRYPDSMVAEARRLRQETDLTYRQIAERLDVGMRTTMIEKWCRGEDRAVARAPIWTRALVVAAIRAFVREEGRRPNFDDLKHDPRLPSLKVIERIFRRWGNALDAAGVEWRDRHSVPKWTLEGVLAAFRAFFEREGHRPTTREFRTAGSGLPTYGVLQRLLGTTSLARVCDLAGVPA